MKVSKHPNTRQVASSRVWKRLGVTTGITTAQAAFRRKCEKVAESTGVEVYWFRTVKEQDYQEPFEDDGNLHIHHKSGEWACFDIGQDRASEEQNTRILAVMTALKLKITDRVLVDGDDEDEDCESGTCPHCGWTL